MKDVEKKIDEIRAEGFSEESVAKMKEVITTSEGLKFLRAKAAKDEAAYEQFLSVSVLKICEMLTDQQGAEQIQMFHGAMEQFDQQAQEMGEDGMPVVVMVNLARLGWLAVWNSMASRSVEQAEELAG